MVYLAWQVFRTGRDSLDCLDWMLCMCILVCSRENNAQAARAIQALWELHICQANAGHTPQQPMTGIRSSMEPGAYACDTYFAKELLEAVLLERLPWCLQLYDPPWLPWLASS